MLGGERRSVHPLDHGTPCSLRRRIEWGIASREHDNPRGVLHVVAVNDEPRTILHGAKHTPATVRRNLHGREPCVARCVLHASLQRSYGEDVVHVVRLMISASFRTPPFATRFKSSLRAFSYSFGSPIATKTSASCLVRWYTYGEIKAAIRLARTAESRRSVCLIAMLD